MRKEQAPEPQKPRSLKTKIYDYSLLLAEVHSDLSGMEFSKEIGGNNISLAIEFLAKASGSLGSYAKSLKED
jgi:hypothetical protein